MRDYTLLLTFLGLFLLQTSFALATDCSEAQKWYQQGVSLSDQSPKEADCYQKALQLCPELAKAHERLGQIYKAQQKWDLAIREFQSASSKFASSSVHTHLGEIYRIRGQYEQAIAEFETALRLNPEDKQAFTHLEYIYRLTGQYDEEDENPELTPIPIFAREPGFTLPQGRTLIDFNLESFQLERDLSTGQERVVNVWKTACGIRYGLTDEVTFGIIPRFFWKKAYISKWENDQEQEYFPTTYGLGDTTMLLKCALWQRKHTSLAAALHLSVPTGDENKTASYGGQTFAIPLGSGKYEFSTSLSLSTKPLPLIYLQSTAHYFFTRTKDNSLDPGDELRYNLSLSRPISFLGTPYLFATPLSGLIVHLELNGVYTGATSGTLSGSPQEVSFHQPAGHTLFLSPGLQFLFPLHLTFECGMQYPVLLPDQPWIEEPIFHLGLTKAYFL